MQNLTPTVAKCSRIAVGRRDPDDHGGASCCSSSSFGFVLRGGVSSDLSVCRPLAVTHIRSGSAADRCVLFATHLYTRRCVVFLSTGPRFMHLRLSVRPSSVSFAPVIPKRKAVKGSNSVEREVNGKGCDEGKGVGKGSDGKWRKGKGTGKGKERGGGGREGRRGAFRLSFPYESITGCVPLGPP